MRRSIAWLALLVAAIAPVSPLIAAEPTIAVQVKSIDGLLEDVKYLAKLVGQGDQADQLDGVLSAWTQDKGLAGMGLDTKRPFLAYAVATAGGQDSPFAIMIPVSDEATFLKVLESLNVKAEKGNDGIYSVDIPNAPVAAYFRFANKYVYVTVNDKAHLEPTKLVAPEQLATANTSTLFGLALRLDQIPDDLKQLMLGQVERRLADVKDQAPSPQQKQGIDTMSFILKALLSEGKSVDFKFSLDRAKDDFDLGLSIDGKPDTNMATIIKMLAGGKTRFAPASNSAFHVGLNFAIANEFKPFLAFAEIAARDGLAREKDEGRRKMMEKMWEAVAPTIKAGVIDLHIAAGTRGSSDKFNVVAGVGVENGQAIESAAKQVVGNLPAAEKANVKFDVSRIGDVNVHELHLNGINADGQRLFGTGASAWAGFAKSAIMLGVGSDAGETFQALTSKSAAASAPLLVLEGSLSRLAKLDADPKAVKVAQSVFGDDPGADRISLSLEGGPSLKLKLSMKALALKFFADLDKAKKGAN